MPKSVTQKVYTRLKRMLGQVVYHNYGLRPRGIYATSRQYASQHAAAGARHADVYPQCVSRLSVPAELYQQLSPYIIYDKPGTEPGAEAAANADQPTLVATNDNFLVRIPRGRVFSNGVDTLAYLTHDHHLLADVSYQHHPDRVVAPEENRVFAQKFFSRPKKYTGTVFSMLSGGGGASNYGHWVIDALPRLHLLRQGGWLERVDWFLVPRLTHDFQLDMLKRLGVDESRLIQTHDAVHVQADFLLTSAHPRGQRSYVMPDWIVDFMRRDFLPFAAALPTTPPLVYVSRRDGTTRRVTNEAAVEQLLESYGFACVELRQLPFVEKMNLFHHARVIVGGTGAGLANLVFCQPGTQVLELFSEGLVHTMWYDIATKVGLDYHYLVSRPAARLGQKAGIGEDITVDLAALRQAVEASLAQGQVVTAG